MAEPFDPPPRRSRRPLPRRSRYPAPRQLIAAVGAIGLIVLVVIVARGGGGENATPVSPEVSKLVRGLSPAEKVDSVLAVGFTGTNAGGAALGRAQGGVVIEPENWPGAKAGRALTSALHGHGEIPPLVIGLQEGGQYRAYPDLPPAARELDIGDAGSAPGAEAWAQQTGAALKKAGFDLNLALVADVATLDSPIADRAFADDTETATAMTAAAVRGCRASGIACAVSHFPGAGAESADTNEGPATVSLDKADLEQRDLAPFRAAFEAGVPAVVLSNAFYVSYDAVTPGALVPGIATGLLRDELGFKGVAITDDLSSGAISGGEGASQAPVRALAAGADLVLVSDPAQAATARKSLLAAAQGGEIPGDRLDQAAGRVLELKKKLGLM